jgi:cell fate (sporulation/competence/biofilm development) regulator YlbF (YheA/YmcA/DUF963 family)
MSNLDEDIRNKIQFYQRRMSSLEKKLNNVVTLHDVKRYIAMRELYDTYMRTTQELTSILITDFLDEE